MADRTIFALVIAACSKSSPPIPPNEVVAGTIAGHTFRAKSAILELPIQPSPRGIVPVPPGVVLYESDVGCDRRHAAFFTEKNVRIRNLPNKDSPGRQRVWFDFCVRYDDVRVECRIQSNEAWLDLEPGERHPGARVRGHFSGTREASVIAAENGTIAGSFDAVVCDADTPGGITEEPAENPE